TWWLPLRRCTVPESFWRMFCNFLQFGDATFSDSRLQLSVILFYNKHYYTNKIKHQQLLGMIEILWRRIRMINNTGIKEKVISSLVNLAEYYSIEKLILFGSRARGDYYKTSDIDLAVTGGNIIEFTLDVEEKVPTLLKFDIVNLDGTVQSELRDSIEKEGIVIYEKI
ncbi:MAG: nucleotidyltransferase domain-containing protein, partial [Blautia sp.]|nr:nucleotidyltransferase domain-containing protein [Blautia sp.]